MRLPEQLIESLEGVPGFDKESFINVHQSGEQVTSIRVNPSKQDRADSFSLQQVPWSRYGYYLEKRPSFTFDPLFHAGCYYVQEASSMFLEQALLQCVDTTQSLKILDLCAAPGGKSTHLQSLISADSLLVSNEVIKNRASVLKQNIIKWGCNNVVVTNNDPQHFARLEAFFDVMVVDAPCSGSGLFRRDENAIQEWSIDNVQLCHARQQRILTDALPCLKEGGVLIYSTCSYSKEEDEDVLDWLVENLYLESLPLELKEEWQIVETISPTQRAKGYRFYPDKLQGEGFFLACFRKREGPSKEKYKTSKPELASKQEVAALRPWMDVNGLSILKHQERVLALPETLLDAFTIIQNTLYIQYAGVDVGELIRDKLIPAHALALSPLANQGVPRTELGYEQAIKYLQRQEFNVESEKGWQLVTYKGHTLGWMNALPNRINNYYPKEMRILKQKNDTRLEN